MVGILALALTASAATAAPKMDIVQTAVSAGQFQTLVAAVKAAGLAETLEGKGPYTVFAPTDEAFQKLPAGTVDSLLKPENKEKLRAILLYHVVPGRLDAAKVSHMTSAKTAQGSDLQIAASGDGVTVNGAHLIKADIAATNGEIHVIDTVLMPPNQ
jgi:uncharacterized surface protein with fasciclin (FAS1) repeats